MSRALKIKKNCLNLPAFSLIEIMAVILIVSLGLVGTMNLASQNIKAQTLNEDNLIAYQLAQEALELARQIRDTNWINNDDWMLSLSSGKYCVDYRNATTSAITAVNDCPLNISSNNLYFSPVIGVLESNTRFSNFYRMLETNVATSSASVKSIVSWTNRNGGVQNYTVETMLYDWR
ncbi:type II secretion system GspH family protein [Patescibacteria group bacterium]|nr:type II secretion system GspH family protein [Patescibacteria group bacterium]